MPGPGAAALLAASVAVLCGAPAAEAHGLAGRADLQIRSGSSASARRSCSCCLRRAGALWSAPRLQRSQAPAAPAALIVDVVLGTLGVLVFGLAVWAGPGTDVERDNLGPTLVFVVFWVAVPFASLLLGDVWRLLSRGGRSGGRRARSRSASRATACRAAAYPARVGGRRGRDLRLRGLRAVLADGPPAGGAGDHHGALPRLLARRDEHLRRRGVDPQRGRLRLLFSLFASLAPFATATACCTCARRSSARPCCSRSPGRSPCCSPHRVDRVRRRKEGPLFNDAVPHVQTFFENLGLSKGAALEWAGSGC